MTVDKIELFLPELVDGKSIAKRQCVIYSLWAEETQGMLNRFRNEYQITVSQITVEKTNAKTTK